MTTFRLLFPSPAKDRHRIQSAGPSGKISRFKKMGQPDMCTIAFVSVPNFLDNRRDHNSRRDHGPLYPDLSHPPVPHRLLYCTGGESPLRCERSHCELPYLSADNIQMGSKSGRRLLRRSENARHVHRNSKPATGRRGCGPAHARLVGIANGHE